MKRIKTFIIHALGGLTVEESRESDANSYNIGCLAQLKDLKQSADLMFGNDADSWCKNMYYIITSRIDRYEGRTQY